MLQLVAGYPRLVDTNAIHEAEAAHDGAKATKENEVCCGASFWVRFLVQVRRVLGCYGGIIQSSFQPRAGLVVFMTLFCRL